MKPLTRFVAWIYILCELPAMLIIALLISGGGLVISGVLVDLSWISKLAGVGVVIIAFMLAGMLLLQVLPWIFLLKKRAWAWWVLTIVYSLVTVACLLPFGEKPSAYELIIPVLTLVVLLLDYPGSWKSRRKTGRRSKRRRTRRTYSRRRR